MERIESAYALEGGVEYKPHPRGGFTESWVNVVQLNSRKPLAEFRKYSFRWNNHQNASCPVEDYMTRLPNVLIQSRTGP